ncbi:glycosyltransferase family 4 protein [Paraburkholderia sp. DD10]|uniref:Glycosyltransferase involved in cell wall bisynthesis n=1 Tax=Paraburkholderia terricola TaxID=169427 RepID=A0A1M6UZ97_9BURK|nr:MULTISPECIES: glycosyltransferase family 4 protein [Paraburkholderia]AXE91467.1 glycosyltransferase family 1 protein [Paraburkholderia terricola]SDO93004.1 Glycosyltransferase involved in cell wall bisynthesis [Paraburkholderia sediminicola]SHK74577.1 Glycosyltransferase involved in cell wall bisynthesis [Paraburkholderia terricola]
MSKVILFANTDWYLYNFRLSLARKLRELGHEVVLLSPPGEYGPQLRALGFRWEPAPMVRRSLNPLREVTLLMWLVRFLRREQPDLVHGFTIKCAVYGSLSSRLAGVAVRVNAVAGMGYVFSSRDVKAIVLRPLVRRVMRTAFGGKGSMLILQNPDDLALFRTANIVDERAIRVIKGSGVNISRFKPRSEEADPLEAQPLRVVLAGRLLWDKGIAEYVEAARILKAEGRSVRCILAGTPDPGNPAAVDENLLRGWVRDGLVEWLGHVSDMPALFAETDVAVLPSYREGLPKSMIEAAACALPLIITDAPGCREVVGIDGEEGLVVPVRDGRALAGAIRRLDDDRALARKLGEAARQKALREFDEQIIIERTLAVYREVLAPARQAMPVSGSVVP